MSFDPANGFLRHIRLGDHEIVRNIYGAVRDHDWTTIPPHVTNLISEISEDAFRLSFDVSYRQGEVDYFWRGSVTGTAEGKVVYTFHSEARSHFRRNRIGLCILHPIAECAGKFCMIEHVDGSKEEGKFPEHISPEQPFFDIRAVSYPIATTGAQARIRCEGDTFEMEDQRNWGDASFKTYSTPQRLPKPVSVKPGEKVEHTITVSITGLTRPILPVLQGRSPQFSITTNSALSLPEIGLCIPKANHSLSAREIDRLKLLRLNHLRVDVDSFGSDLPEALKRAAAQASALGCSLHIALTLPADPSEELRNLQQELQRTKPPVSLWLLFERGQGCASEKLVRAAQPILQAYAPNVLVAAGTHEWFVELNRSRPAFSALPVFAASPQIHQTDNMTMVENLAGLANQAETAKDFSPRPVAYSPITLRASPRLKRDGAGPLPDDVEARQLSLFGAGWTLGCIARLAGTGNAHALTFYETVGAAGVVESEAGSPYGDSFPSMPESVFPMYHVFADLAEFGASKMFPTVSTHPLLTDGLTLVDVRGRRRILIANLFEETLEVKIKSGQGTAEVRLLDETNAKHAMENPESFRAQRGKAVQSVGGKIELKLLPFALARVDLI